MAAGEEEESQTGKGLPTTVSMGCISNNNNNGSSSSSSNSSSSSSSGNNGDCRNTAAAATTTTTTTSETSSSSSSSSTGIDERQQQQQQRQQRQEKKEEKEEEEEINAREEASILHQGDTTKATKDITTTNSSSSSSSLSARVATTPVPSTPAVSPTPLVLPTSLAEVRKMLSVPFVTVLLIFLAALAYYMSTASRTELFFWSTLSTSVATAIFLHRLHVPSLLPTQADHEEAERAAAEVKRKTAAEGAIGADAPRCHICSRPDCTRHQLKAPRTTTHPWEGLKVPVKVDGKLEAMMERALHEYVASWHQNISREPEFCDELRFHFRFIAATIVRRLGRVNLHDFVLYKIVPAVCAHMRAVSRVQTYLKSSSVAGHYRTGEEKKEKDAEKGKEVVPQAVFEQLVLEELAGFSSDGCHVAARGGGTGPAVYLVHTAESLLEHIIHPEANASNSLRVILRDMVASFVLVPTLEFASSPSFINTRLVAALGNEDTPWSNIKPSESQVELLAHMCAAGDGRNVRRSALSVRYSHILDKSQPALLAAYMSFLKRTDAIHLLMFTMDVERFMEEYQLVARDGDPQALERACREARQIYESFLDPAASDLRFADGVVEGIYKRCFTNTGSLDPFIFAPAYDEIYGALEREHYPKFLQSEEYFRVIVGTRKSAKTRTTRATTTAKSSGRGRSPKTSRRKQAPPQLTAADLEIMKNLPAPPSATADPHELAAPEEERRKKLNFFGRNRSSNSTSSTSSPATERRAVPTPAVAPAAAVIPTPSSSDSAANASAATTTTTTTTTATTTTTSTSTPPPTTITIDAADDTAAAAKLGGDGREDKRSRSASFWRRGRLTSGEGSSSTSPTTPATSEDATAAGGLWGVVAVGDGGDEQQAPTSLEGIRTRIKEAATRGRGPSQHSVYIIEIIRENDELGRDTVKYFSPELGNTWVVERRYSEFHSLNRLLKSYFPVLSAELPAKKAIGNRDAVLIEQRKQQLGQYLVDLLANELMQTDPRCTSLIHWFLQPGSTFKQLMKKAESISVAKIVGYVPPIWAAKMIVNKVDERFGANPAQLEFLCNTFVVTQQDLDEEREAMMQVQTALGARATEKAALSASATVESEHHPASPDLSADLMARVKALRANMLLLQTNEAEKKTMGGAGAGPGVGGATVDSGATTVDADANANASAASSLHTDHTRTAAAGPADWLLELFLTIFARLRRVWLVKLLGGLAHLALSHTTSDWVVRQTRFALHWNLSEPELLADLDLLNDTIFAEEAAPVDVAAEARAYESAKRVVRSTVPSLARTVLGPEINECCDAVVDGFQSHLLNRQLILRIMDLFLAELVPEATSQR